MRCGAARCGAVWRGAVRRGAVRCPAADTRDDTRRGQPMADGARREAACAAEPGTGRVRTAAPDAGRVRPARGGHALRRPARDGYARRAHGRRRERRAPQRLVQDGHALRRPVRGGHARQRPARAVPPRPAAYGREPAPTPAAGTGEGCPQDGAWCRAARTAGRRPPGAPRWREPAPGARVARLGGLPLQRAPRQGAPNARGVPGVPGAPGVRTPRGRSRCPRPRPSCRSSGPASSGASRSPPCRSPAGR